jgi:hypothetical protein
VTCNADFSPVDPGIYFTCQWQGLEVEASEMWNHVGSKQQQRWLWHAPDYATGEVLMFVLSNLKIGLLAHSKHCEHPFA